MPSSAKQVHANKVGFPLPALEFGVASTTTANYTTGNWNKLRIKKNQKSFDKRVNN